MRAVQEAAEIERLRNQRDAAARELHAVVWLGLDGIPDQIDREHIKRAYDILAGGA